MFESFLETTIFVVRSLKVGQQGVSAKTNINFFITLKGYRTVSNLKGTGKFLRIKKYDEITKNRLKP